MIYINHYPNGIGFEAQIVDTLPALENANTHTIYLIPSTSATTADYYEEYIVTTGNDNQRSWERIGTTEIHVNNCTPREEFDEYVAETDAKLADIYTKEEVLELCAVVLAEAEKHSQELCAVVLAEAETYTQELCETVSQDANQYTDDVMAAHKIYCHNIWMQYKHTSTEATSLGDGDGMFEINFQIFNKRQSPYSFTRINITQPTELGSDEIKSLRTLFNALCEFTGLHGATSASGMASCRGTSSGNTPVWCVVGSIKPTLGTDENGGNTRQQIRINATKATGGGFGAQTINISCGNQQEDGTVDSDANHFTQQNIAVVDHVAPLF